MTPATAPPGSPGEPGPGSEASSPWLRDGLVLGLMVLLPLAAIPLLPERFPVHWDFRGRPDRWVSPWPGVLWYLLVPLLTGGAVALVRYLFRRSVGTRPARPSVRSALDRILSAMLLLVLLLEASLLAEGIAPRFPGLRVAIALLCAGLAPLGPLLRDLPRNGWIGVRTPWSLADDGVWDRTHRVAARVYPAGGILAAGIAALAPSPLHLPAALGVLVVAALSPALYSYATRARGRRGRRE